MTNTHSIVLGGGCFWCLEASYQMLRGIEDVVPGYAGGTTHNPTYEDVCNGFGNHAEVVNIFFNPDIVSLRTLLEFFWAAHDPTTPNRQGHDIGPQYRSIVFYTNEVEKQIIIEARQQAQEYWDKPIVTEIVELQTFYEAENYHKNYFKNNPNKAYCQVVINPKLQIIKKQFSELMALT